MLTPLVLANLIVVTAVGHAQHASQGRHGQLKKKRYLVPVFLLL